MTSILSGLYFNMTSQYPFKRCLCSHKYYLRIPMERAYYRITDLELWFESDLEEGAELIIMRVSENGRYDFNRHMRCFL